MQNYTIFTLYSVISEPDDVAVCEGKQAELNCVLDGSIASGYILWYRLVKDTGITEMIDQQGSNIHFTNYIIINILTSQLTITNTRKSDIGYYWIRTPSSIVCNASVTVLASMYSMHVEFLIHNMHNTK